MVKENSKRNETILSRNQSISKLKDSTNELNISIEFKSIKSRLSKKFKKCELLFKGLTLSSSYKEFHQFRKCCKQLYFQHAVLNKIGLEKTHKPNKRLLKLTEQLGNEHDLEMLHQYLKDYFKELDEATISIFTLRIEKLRRKILRLYPKIHYPS